MSETKKDLTFTHPDPGGVTSTIPTEPNGKINRYIMPFNDQKDPKFAAYSSLYQAQQMLANFKAILDKNPAAKIAITYSANETQAEQLMAGYTSNDNQSSILAGGVNQAEVFRELINLLQQEPELKNKIHILPIATMPAGDNTQPASKESVNACMANIAKHLGADWIVLGLCNQGTKPPDYAIGGGVATGWKDSQGKNLCDKALTCMTADPLAEVSDLDDADIKNLKAAFADGKQSPNSLLAPVLDQKQTEEEKPENFADQLKQLEGEWPDSASAEANPKDSKGQSITVTVDDFTDIKNFIITAEDNTKHKEQNFIGTITNGKKAEEQQELVYIKQDGSLICPPVSDENKQLQVEAIVSSLSKMAEKVTNPPLSVQIKGFTANELEPILQKLKDQHTNISVNLDPEYFGQLSDTEKNNLTTLLNKFTNDGMTEQKEGPVATLSDKPPQSKIEQPQPHSTAKTPTLTAHKNK